MSNAKELFEDSIAVVFLDNGAPSRRLARLLLRKYGVSSLLCGRKKRFADAVDSRFGFIRLDVSADGRLAVERLIDLADEYSDCILILCANTDSGSEFVSLWLDVLESRYVLSPSPEDYLGKFTVLGG